MLPRTYRSGQWMVVECADGLDASSAAWLRDLLGLVRDPSWGGVIMDFGRVDQLDPTARRILANFHRTLSLQGRQLGVVAAKESVRSGLELEGVQVLAELSELKRSIHEMAPERYQALVQSGAKASNLFSFRLRCPVCHCDEVKGWMPDPALHEMRWKPNEITRQCVYMGEAESSLETDAYAVAVCPECLFAASRLDWFDLPAAKLTAALPEGAHDRLSKSFGRRRAALQELTIDVPNSVFFGMPRLPLASQTAWLLAEESTRAMGRDRGSADGFAIGVSILMQAKFASQGCDLGKFYTAAYVWLRQVVEQDGNYAEERLWEANVYLLSVELALGRDQEARQMLRAAEERWGRLAEFQPWAERCRMLLAD